MFPFFGNWNRGFGNGCRGECRGGCGGNWGFVGPWGWGPGFGACGGPCNKCGHCCYCNRNALFLQAAWLALEQFTFEIVHTRIFEPASGIAFTDQVKGFCDALFQGFVCLCFHAA